MAINGMGALQKRLIAAGAQPERAQGFVEQAMFNKGPQLTTFGGASKVSGGIKPIVLGDPYDDKTTQARKDTFPNLFYPPEPESPDFKPYFDVVLGKGAYDNFYNKSFASQAPTYSTAKKSKDNFDLGVVKLIEAGLSLPQINASIAQSVTDKKLKYPQGMLSTDANSYVKDIFTEYYKAKNSVDEILVTRLKQDNAYKFGLPDKKLQYGLVTDLNKGIISITFQPAVAKALADYQQDPKFASQKNAFLRDALNKVNAAKLTPFIDAKKLGEKFRNKRP